MADTAVASPIKSEHSTRKNKKPLMEKRRRARINSCLSQLKSLVLQAIKKDSSQFSKLEKADILELTVKHLRALQRQQAAGVMTSDPDVVSKYRAGFNECAKEVIRYMGSVRDVHDDVKERVVGHLAGCLQVVNHVSPAESLQQQQCMKPLHVHIPPQGPVNAGVAASAVILPPQAAMPPTMTFTPSPVGSTSPDSRHSSSPISGTAISAVPVQAMSGVTTAPTAVISHNQNISGAFKIVPTSSCPSGAVALYLGGANVSRAGDNLSVDAVPLYSVSLPQTDGGVTAFVPPPATSSLSVSHGTSSLSASHGTSSLSVSHSQSVDSRSSANVSPIRMDYSSVSPVDLRQKVKSSHHSFAEPHLPLSLAQCNPASLSDEKLWRPW